MRTTVTMNEVKLVRDIMGDARALRADLEKAMAHRFWEMTLSNFGIAGADRPRYWPPLSPAYAKKVGREVATLYVSGRLKGAVHQEGNTVSVSNADAPYALAHQFGSRKANLPARPYFPIKPNGDCMDFTYSQVVEAGQQELDKFLG